MPADFRKESLLKPSAKKVITIASLLSLSCLSFGTYQFLERTRANQQYSQEFHTNEPKESNLIAALGRVEPQGEVVIVGGPLGERIGNLVVKESQQVTKGNIIAYLESYQERLAEKQVSASQLREARQRLKTETNLGYAAIKEAQSRLEQVKLPQFLGIEAQQASVKRLELELENAKTTLERFQKLKDEGAISQQTLDEKLLAFSSKKEELNNAKATLAKLTQERATNLLNANTQIQSAQASLQRSRSQVLVESSLQNLNLAKARLERTIIRAPRSGQILKIFAHTGETITQQGILQLGNTQQMYIVAEVYETDVTKLRVGQKATITSNAFQGELQGTVDLIGLQIGKKDILATDPAAEVDSRVVEVKIRLNSKDSQRVAGLTNLQVNVKIHI
jgi:HlyD family secretion protein